MSIVAKLTSGSTLSAKLTSGSNTLTLKNAGTSGNRLDSLSDVNTSNSSANGSILVYDNRTDTYVQRDILSFDVESGAFNLDGGEDGF
jgi:hypothetical protein